MSWWAKEGLDNPSSANYGASNVAKPGQMIIKIMMLLIMMVAATMKMTDKLNNPSRANYGGRPPCQNLSGQSDKPPVRPPGNNQSMLHSIRWHSFNFQSIHTHSKLAIGLASWSLPVHSLADISSKSCLIATSHHPHSIRWVLTTLAIIQKLCSTYCFWKMWLM